MRPLSDDFWSDLIERVDDGSVVPIVGQDLLTIPGKSGSTTLHQLLAVGLAEELGVDLSRWPGGFSLNDVICASERFQGRRQSVYPRIRAALDGLPTDVPVPLRQLAEILPLRLFVSTTFDTLLQQALNEVRHGGRPETRVVVYSPNNVKDLPEEVEPAAESVVFQLLGRVSASPDYAATDGDLLEFMHHLQSADRHPRRLLDELRQRHLLLLGNSFPDWLERFFLRVVKADRLWSPRDRTELVADAEVRRNPGLAMFVDQFSCETTVFLEGDAVEFVRQLHERWRARHPAEEQIGPGRDLAASAVLESAPVRSVFLSYARDDIEAVLLIKGSLEAEGLDVWCDTGELKAGADWDRRIRQGIRRCTVFVPVISANTERRQEAYFRQEWSWAVERLPLFAGIDRPFLFPLVIDGTTPAAARGVLDEFRRFQWAAAPAGQTPREFTRSLLQVVRQIRLRET